MIEAGMEIPANHRRGTIHIQFTCNLVQSRHFYTTITTTMRQTATPHHSSEAVYWREIYIYYVFFTYLNKQEQYTIQYTIPTSSRVTRSGLRQTATPHLGCSPSSESGLFPSPAQRHGTLSLPNYAPSLTLAFLRTS